MIATELTRALREIADALEEDRLAASELMVIGRLEDGGIISEDSGLTLTQAAMLARDFCCDLSRLHRNYYGRYYPRGKRGQRCQGVRLGR